MSKIVNSALCRSSDQRKTKRAYNDDNLAVGGRNNCGTLYSTVCRAFDGSVDAILTVLLLYVERVGIL